MKNHKFNKSDYAAMAGIFLLLNIGINAGVVYTNIDPDTTIFNNNGIYQLDIDADADVDFTFFNNNISSPGFYTYSSNYYPPHFKQEIFITPFAGGSVAGSKSNTFSFSDFYYFPFALISGNFVEPFMMWQNGNDQQLIYQSAIFDWSNVIAEGGNWEPETTNHFVGIRFNDDQDSLHYGWIRCDITGDGQILIIKDYAYETTPNKPIIAGDTLMSNIGEVNTINANIYSTANNISIQLAIINPNTIVQVFDISGKLILTKTLTNLNTKISLNTGTGLYLVKLKSETYSFEKTVFLNM